MRQVSRVELLSKNLEIEDIVAEAQRPLHEDKSTVRQAGPKMHILRDHDALLTGGVTELILIGDPLPGSTCLCARDSIDAAFPELSRHYPSTDDICVKAVAQATHLP